MKQTKRTISRPLSRTPESSQGQRSFLCVLLSGLSIVFLLCVGLGLSFVLSPPQQRDSSSTIATTTKKDKAVHPPLLRKIKTDLQSKIESVKDTTATKISEESISLTTKTQSIERPKEEEHPPTTTSNSIVLRTPHGNIQIKLRPDLSSESVTYIKQITAAAPTCPRCQFYRAENDGGILQGVIANPSIPANTILGPCPPDAPPSKNCPEWDKQCGCHGPIMTRGMVGWAGGKAGPDFFIDLYKRPAKFWETQHTVWGEVAEDDNGESFETIERIFGLERKKGGGGMTMLKEVVTFTAHDLSPQ